MKDKKRGFTLIEMIVVIGVIALALPVLFNIIFLIIQQESRVYRLTQMKRQGDYALSVMENLIQNNAQGISNGTISKCSLSGSTFTSNTGSGFYFIDRNGTSTNPVQFRFLLSSQAIASASSALVSPIALTDSNIIISQQHDSLGAIIPFIQCSNLSQSANPVVIISFKVSYAGNTALRASEQLPSLDYSTAVKLQVY